MNRPVTVTKTPHRELGLLGDYHQDIALDTVWGDVVGRVGNGHTTQWVPIVCNNTDCGALWLLNAHRAHELIQDAA